MLSFRRQGVVRSGTRGFLALMTILPPAGWPWGESAREPVEIPDRCLEAPLHEAPPPADAWRELLVPDDRPIRLRRFDPDLSLQSNLGRWRVWRSSEWTRDALIVRRAPSDSTTVRIPWQEIAVIDHSLGSQSPWPLAVLGASLGFLVSLGARRDDCRDEECSQRDNITMLTGAGVGALAGGLLAKLIPRWGPIYCVLPPAAEEVAEEVAEDAASQ